MAPSRSRRTKPEELSLRRGTSEIWCRCDLITHAKAHASIDYRHAATTKALETHVYHKSSTTFNAFTTLVMGEYAVHSVTAFTNASQTRLIRRVALGIQNRLPQHLLSHMRSRLSKTLATSLTNQKARSPNTKSKGLFTCKATQAWYWLVQALVKAYRIDLSIFTSFI